MLYTPLNVEIQSTDGALAPVGASVIITKGTTAALTLTVPPASSIGQILVITSGTAAAHTVTGSLNGASATGTFGAAIGNGLILVAGTDTWLVVSNTNVTIV